MRRFVSLCGEDNQAAFGGRVTGLVTAPVGEAGGNRCASRRPAHVRRGHGRRLPVAKGFPRVRYDASSNQSSVCGGARAGAKVAGSAGRPSAASTARAIAGTMTMATTERRPPHGQRRTSSANTRRKSSAHGRRRVRCPPAGVVAAQLDAVASSDGAAGTSARSFARSLLAGPNTPYPLHEARSGRADRESAR